jgi:hypothetical protein
LVTGWMNTTDKPDDKGMNRVVGLGVTKDKLNEYVSIFANLKCQKPRGVDVGINALKEYMDNSELKDITDPIMVIEVTADSVRTFLFDKQSFILQRQIKYEPGEKPLDAAVACVMDQASMMQQFQAAHRDTGQIKNVYVFGDAPDIEQIAGECSKGNAVAFQNMPRCAHLETAENLNYLNYINIIGSAVTKKSEVNFLEMIKDTMKAQRAVTTDGVKKVAWIAIAAAIPMAVYGYTLWQKDAAITAKVKVENAYLSNQDNIDKLNQITQQKSEIALYDGISTQLESAAYINDTYLPSITSGLVSPIYGYKDVVINAMSCDSDTMNVSCESANIESPYKYVNYLQATDKYEKVEYNGFTEGKDNVFDPVTGAQHQEIRYVFEVALTLKRGQPDLSTIRSDVYKGVVGYDVPNTADKVKGDK